MSIWEQLKSSFTSGKPVEAIFEKELADYLEQNLALYARFPNELKSKLHRKIAELVAVTYFKGCGGLELSHEIIITIAGQACMLVVNHPGKPYPHLKIVQVYPSTFIAITRESDARGVITKKETRSRGASCGDGTVILAWDSVIHGAINIFDGRNVIFHEFATNSIKQTAGRWHPYPSTHPSLPNLGPSHERRLSETSRLRKTWREISDESRWRHQYRRILRCCN